MSTSDICKICKDSASSDVCELEEKLQNISIADNGDVSVVIVCANCGKEGDDVKNICKK